MDEPQLRYTKLKAARFKRLCRVGPVTGHSGIHRTVGKMRSGARAGGRRGQLQKGTRGFGGNDGIVLYFDCCGNYVFVKAH